MPESQIPSIFVSSTCYDLSQIRADLERAITRLGLAPIVSESFAFPVNPDATVVENCLRVVKDRADIFVLIVGGRYGSVTDSGRSVTNLEYLEAKTRGIPIYVFVLKSLLQMIPVWKKNPDGDFSDVVDSPKLFQFVEEVRSTKEHWVFPFEEAADIEQTLQKQLAYLFMDSLLVRARVRALQLPVALGELSGRSLRLLMEKPPAWEHFFFASILEEELRKNADLKWDVKYALRTGATRNFSTSDIKHDALATNNWILAKISNARSLVESVSNLMNIAIQEAFGPPGVAGDPEHIAYVARKLGLNHRRLLEWSADFNDVEVLPQFSRLLSLVASFSTDAIAQLESLPERLRIELEKAINAKRRGETYIANVMLIFQGPKVGDEIAKEYERLVAWVSGQD
jgi:hypothetical protein